MEYVYSFNPERTHTITMAHRVIQHLVKEGGNVEIVLELKITERFNGGVTRSESTNAAFSYRTNAEDEYPLQVDRIRDGDTSKFILSIWNASKPAERAEVGIITELVSRNPYFVDMYYNEPGYQGSIKAPRIERLDSYTAPVLTQTVFNHTFDQAGLPDYFVTTSDVHIPGSNYLEIKEFQYALPHQVPDYVPWVLSMDIAPKSMTPTEDDKIFEIEIDQVGKFSLELNRITFIRAGTINEIESKFAEPIEKDKLFTTNFNALARLTISAAGNGGILIAYAGKEFNTLYDHSKKISYIHFNSAMKEGAIAPTNANREAVRLDNLRLTYRK